MAKKKTTKAEASEDASKSAPEGEIMEENGDDGASDVNIDMDEFLGENSELLNEDLEVLEDFDDGLDHVSIKELDEEEGIVETKIKKGAKGKKSSTTEKAIEAAKEVANSLVQENLNAQPYELNYAIKDLPGVGATIAKKLAEAGFETLNSIAMTPLNVLVEQGGIGEKTAEKIIKSARDALNIGFRTAEVVWEKRKNLARITTGSKALDNILGGGGIETGSVTELYGTFKSGKTQLCHQLCVNIQKPKADGGLEGAALYIDSEGTFRPERLIQMAEAAGLDPKKVLKNVITARAYSSDHQVMLIRDAARIIPQKNIKLIVVDSIIAHFRSEYIGRGTLSERQQQLNVHLHDLQRLAEVYPELAVVVTNQVQAKPDTFFGDPNKAAGGNVIAHASTVRVYLRKGKDDQRVAKIVDAPNLPEEEAIFVVKEGGIFDEE
jgi:DNA repair protein RadA